MKRGMSVLFLYLLVSFGLLIETVDEDLCEVIQFLQESEDWLCLAGFVLLINGTEASNKTLLLREGTGQG